MTWEIIIIVFLLAMVMGAVVGLLPGLPALLGIFLLLPVFAKWPAEAILLFFSCYICVTQYFGSVSALLFKVPGESSSIPALEISEKLKRFTSIVKAYRATALTSFIASLIGVVLFLTIFFVFKKYWPYIFSVKFTVIFLTLLMSLLILQNKQYIYNILLLVVGLILSQSSQFIFLDHICQSTEWLCFLRSPINNNLILISLFSVPLLFYKTPNAVPIGSATTQLPTWRSILPMYKKGVGHGLLGFIVGFTPGVGVSLASNLSASIERYRNKFRSLSYIAAAEGANNSAAISCLIPFLFLGLPITPSELIIDQFLVGKFYRLNLDSVNQIINISGDPVNFITVIVTAIVLCNIACFMLCGNFIRLWKNLLTVDIRWYLAIIKILVVCSIGAIVYTGQIPWTTALFDVAVFGGFGYWAMRSNRDVMGLAVSMMLGPFIIDKFTMAYYLYF